VRGREEWPGRSCRADLPSETTPPSFGRNDAAGCRTWARRRLRASAPGGAMAAGLAGRYRQGLREGRWSCEGRSVVTDGPSCPTRWEDDQAVVPGVAAARRDAANWQTPTCASPCRQAASAKGSSYPGHRKQGSEARQVASFVVDQGSTVEHLRVRRVRRGIRVPGEHLVRAGLPPSAPCRQIVARATWIERDGASA
jgi:hypothetical protein